MPAESGIWIGFHNTDSVNGEDAGQPVLSREEEQRAARFHFDRDRRRWIRGREWVRQQLGRALSLPPHLVEIAAEPGGRLYVPGRPFDFNLSHTGPWIGLAICQEGRIGLDIETIDPAFPALEIAAEFFLPEERDWIAAGPAGRFFQLWTAKEALMKATGRGMSLEPGSIRVNLENDHPVSVTCLEDGTCLPVHVRPGPGDTMAATVWIPDSGPLPPAARASSEQTL